MRGIVLALGNFDGVHLGHRAVIARAVEEGKKRALRVVAAFFDPHPRVVLRPGEEPRLLTTPEVRRELLLSCGVDEARTIAFDLDLARKSPESFVREVLVGELETEVVVVGENFRFGHKAAGDFGDLKRLMRELGGEALAVPVLSLGEDVSSTRIRGLVANGEVIEAARLLGTPYYLKGEVVVGDRRGRTIGFPTANVVPDPRVLVPGLGVYAGRALVGREWYGACTNVGVAPTFDRRERRVEAHLLDYDGDLYGHIIDVTFVERLRPEMRFSGVEELKAQIARDVDKARRSLARDEGRKP
ncbi:MAG: bifunctional riboflavin kinase/FAD synthetase [Rubrobacter sp.]